MSLPTTSQATVLFPDGMVILLRSITSLQAALSAGNGIVNVGVGGAINAYTFATGVAGIANAQYIVDQINKLLNGSPLGQSTLINLTPLIPQMTSDTAPSGIASASTEAVGGEAWHAFNNSDGLSWEATSITLPQFIKYQFGGGQTAQQYSVYNDTGGVFPTAWVLEGSNDDSTYTLLDSQTGGKPQPSQFTIASPASYVYYRWTITAMNVGQPAYFSVLQLYG